MSNNSSFLARHRRTLLGAAAAIALAGSATLGGALLTHGPSTARAEVAATVRPSGFADVVARVKPAVVAVIVKRDAAPGPASVQEDVPELSPDHPLYRFFRQFRDRREQQGQPRGSAQGSGFFISADGYLLTNNHVVEGGGEYHVVTDDGRDLRAKLVGRDARTDLALLKVDADKPFPFVTFSASQPRVGDWVVAIGNPFGLGGTVTAGIVSARGRDIGSGPYDDFLQIDAPVNRGNSGGPTFNLDGEVIGINTAIFSPSGGSVGIGFAIPSNVAENVVAQLRKDGAVVRGWLGVRIQPVTEEIAGSIGLGEAKGALVADIEPASPAARAGVKPGDVILAIDGTAIRDSRDLQRRVAALKPGSSQRLDVLRRGQKQTVTVEFGQLPGEPEQAQLAPDSEGEPSRLGGLGLTLVPAKRGGEGVTIAAVDPRGPAASQGIRAGDVILDIGGETVAQPADVRAKLADARQSGLRSVLARIRQNGRSLFVALPVQQG